MRLSIFRYQTAFLRQVLGNMFNVKVFHLFSVNFYVISIHMPGGGKVPFVTLFSRSQVSSLIKALPQCWKASLIRTTMAELGSLPLISRDLRILGSEVIFALRRILNVTSIPEPRTRSPLLDYDKFRAGHQQLL
jgi:hypothetical protein